MGTRSLTRVIETWKDKEKNKVHKSKIVCMYRQFDGYPSGHGADLVEFLTGSKVVNGLSMNDLKSTKVFNGVGCLAAQLIAHFKQGAGGIYLYNPNAKDCGQEYEYELEVSFDTKEVIFRCFEVGYMSKNRKGESVYVGKKRKIFEGKAEDFLEAVKKQKEAENA